jgi:hypothetical protein
VRRADRLAICLRAALLNITVPLSRVATLLIGRIASPASVAFWIVLARRATVRDLRAAIARARAVGTDSPPMGDAALNVGSRPDVDSSGQGDSAVHPPSRLEHSVSDADPADRTLVRVPVPLAIQAAFDEVLDLYRAVEGREASVTSFVEALVAENSSGGTSGDVLDGVVGAPLTHGPSPALVETALARSTDNWRHLPAGSAISPVLALAVESVASLEELSTRAGTGLPADLLDQMRALISLENDIEIRLGRLLAAMADHGAWSRLRFAGIGHYAEERLGLSRTAAEERARATRVLHSLPRLRELYESDRLGLDATLTVARILNQVRTCNHGESAAPEEAWTIRASETTVKRLRDEANLLRRRAATCIAARSHDPALTDEEAPRRTAPHDPMRLGSGDDAMPTGLPDASDGCPVHPLEDAAWHASLRRRPGTACRRVHRFGMLAAGLGGSGAQNSGPLEAGSPEPLSPATALTFAPDVFHPLPARSGLGRPAGPARGVRPDLGYRRAGHGAGQRSHLHPRRLEMHGARVLLAP